MHWNIQGEDLIVHSLENAKKFRRWREGMKTRNLIVNEGKTKVMINSMNVAPVSRSAVCKCAVCRMGVGCNFILYFVCDDWVHNTCSDMMGSLGNIISLSCSV